MRTGFANLNWICHYDSKTEQQSKEWKHMQSRQPKKFSLQPTASNTMGTVFLQCWGYGFNWLYSTQWNSHRRLLCWFTTVAAWLSPWNTLTFVECWFFRTVLTHTRLECQRLPFVSVNLTSSPPDLFCKPGPMWLASASGSKFEKPPEG